jgi:Winged helix DNA-binding domain
MVFELCSHEVESLTKYNHDQYRISIFADEKLRLPFLQSVVCGMGFDILYAGNVVDGATRLINFPSGDAIIINIENDGGPALDALLDRLNALSVSDSLPVLVNSSPEYLDHIAAWLDAPSVTLMCHATAVDWVAALAMIGVGRPNILHDVALDESMRLQQLADEVQRIAKTLADLAGPAASDAAYRFRAGSTPYTMSATNVNAADVRAIIRLRRLRDRYFSSELFADPAWDMLLDLMAARIERKRVPVSSLCIAAAVPPTTALRWIKTMCDHGLFVRVADPEDGRRVFIELSDGAATAMTAYLSAAKATGGLAV